MTRTLLLGAIIAVLLSRCARQKPADSTEPEVRDIPTVIANDDDEKSIEEFHAKIEGTWAATECRYLAPANAIPNRMTTYVNDRVEFGSDGLFSLDTRIYTDPGCHTLLNRLLAVGRFTLSVNSAKAGVYTVRAIFRRQYIPKEGTYPPIAVSGSSKYRELFLSSTKNWVEGIPLRILGEKLYLSYHTTKFTHHYRKLVPEITPETAP